MHPASVNKPNFILLQYTPVHTHDKGGKLDCFYTREVKITHQFSHHVHFSDHTMFCSKIKLKD